MNIHHLELFYYVARHGGIAAAVRNIPYGIQQPAVSGQIAKLEEHLGVKLFERRPFALSPEGAELFGFIEPFFAKLDDVEAAIRGGGAPQLRIAAPAIALHDYVPAVLERVRAQFREFRLRLHEASQPDAEKLVRSGEVDIAITLVEKKLRDGTQARALLDLPLVLLVPKRHALRDAETLWRSDKIEQTLISLSPADAVSMRFQEELEKRGLVWNCGIEVNSLSLIECYVENGYGIGLSVIVPGAEPPKSLRALPLAGFPPVTVGAIWARNLSPIAGQFLAELEVEAASHRA